MVASGQALEPSRRGRFGTNKMIEMIVSSFIVGVLVAIPPGTVTVTAAQKTLLYGLKSSLIFTFGSCLSDIIYILIVFLGLAPLFNHSILFKVSFWYFSSIILFYFGYDSLRTIRKKADLSNIPMDQKTLFKDFLSGVLITLSNPMTIAGWLVIAGSFFTHWKVEWPSIHSYGLFSISFIMLGVLCWFIPLLFIISKVRDLLNTKVIKSLILISAIFFFGVGLFSIFSATDLILINQ
jgi:threonine/homoserine/homoserine lactone efflux protein